MAYEATAAGDARQRRYARPLAGTGSAPLRRQRREQFRSGEVAPSPVTASPSDNQGVVEGGQTVVGACLEERRQWAPASPATTRPATDRSRQQFNRRQTVLSILEATGNHNRAVGQDRGCAVISSLLQTRQIRPPEERQRVCGRRYDT